MNDETLIPLINRIDGLENQINTIEDQRRKESRGWLARISRIGIVVGCLGGILGGSSTFLNLWNEYRAKPDTALIPGGDIDLSLDQDGRLDLKCGLVVYNKGRASDAVRAARAYLLDGVPPSQEPFNLEDIRVIEKGVKTRFPISVGATDMREIEIAIGSKLPPEKQQAFREAGLHRLVLEFDADQPNRQATYCFWMGQEAANILVKEGRLAIANPFDSRCPSGIQ